MAQFQYQFEWDPRKARLNLKRHGVAFERAATIFQDRNALSEFDEALPHFSRQWLERSPSADFGSKGNQAWKGGIWEKENTMKREYDFSKAEQGKFYRKGAVIQLPIYLDAKVQAQVERVARKNGKDVSELVNQVVQKEMELIEKLTH